MGFRISGLDPAPFAPLFDQTDAELAAQHIKRMTVNGQGFPDRITMADLEEGDSVLLLNWEHLPVDSPYRSRHAIYVKEGATEAYMAENEIPEVLAHREVACRGIDKDGMITDAELATGDGIAATIERIFQDPDVAYIHVHYAARGCFAGRVDRVPDGPET